METGFQYYRVISAENIESIHLATVRILQDVGIVLENQRAIDMLVDAGAKIIGSRLSIPESLLEECLKSCGGSISLFGRDGTSVSLGDGSLNWHNLGGAPNVFEPSHGKFRGASIHDVQDAAKLLDSLENVTTITPFFTPLDVPGEVIAIEMYHHSIPYTTKPLHGPGIQNEQEVKFIAELASVVGNPEDVLSLGVSPISPLFFPSDTVAAMIAIAEQKIPFGPLPCPTAGATAPVTLAGALAQQNAEILASVVIAQIVNPGTPIFYCGRLALMEPYSGLSVWGAMELGMISAATVQLGHYYDFPANVYGFSTNSHEIDFQSGQERAINALIPAIAGADELSGIGEMEAGLMGAYAQMVLDNEIVGGIRHIRNGIKVDSDSLAIDLIREVMEGPRNFIGERHTVEHLRSGEFYIPKLADRKSYELWDQGGRESMVNRAQAEADRLIQDHEVTPLDEDQEAEIAKIMIGAWNELVD